MGDAQAPSIEYHLLGNFRVLVDGEELRFGGVKQRSVLAMLVLDANRLVTVSRLIEGLWADDAPDRALSTIQVYVSGLRKLLPRPEGESPIVTHTNGYLLRAPREAIDVLAFRAELDAARDSLRRGEHRSGLGAVNAALGMWNGDPLVDFIDQPFAPAHATALHEEYDLARELRHELMVRSGQHNEALPELERAVAEAPLRESSWRLLMLAQYRAGRQADALDTYRRCRDALVEALGIDPSPETQALEMAVLSHDPSLLEQPPAGRRAEPTIPAVAVAPLAIAVDDEAPRALRSTVLIGRSDECDIVVDDAYVSRRHAEIRHDARGWTLVDLSLNGTLVNGVASDEHHLLAGDEITIGSRTIRVEPGA